MDPRTVARLRPAGSSAASSGRLLGRLGARAKQTYRDVYINIALRGKGFASAAELALRDRVEDLLVERSVGDLQGGGSGLGMMDVSVQVQERDRAKRQVGEIVREVDPDLAYSLDWYDAKGNRLE